jgi:hypothetical protein
VGTMPIPALDQDIAENEKRNRSRFENFMQEHGVPRGGDTKALSSAWLKGLLLGLGGSGLFRQLAC